MKKFCFILLFALSQLGFAQFPVYKNFFGLIGPPNYHAPVLDGLKKLNDNSYILTFLDQSYGFCGYLKLDSNLNFVWQKNFNLPAGCTITHVAELTDGGLVSVYNDNSGNACLLRFDNAGNVIFDNYYHTATSSAFTTQVVCPSQENDTGFLALYQGCILKYGIARYNSDGSVRWCYEYNTGGYYGNVYDLERAFNRGYITIGAHINSITQDRSAMLVQFDNNGFPLRSKEYFLDTSNSQFNQLCVGNDDHYYVNGSTFHMTPANVYDSCTFLMQLDSELNVTKCFRFEGLQGQSRLLINEVIAANDGTLFLAFSRVDNVNGHSLFSLIHFDPSGNGNIIWCKKFISPNPIPAYFSYPYRGMYLNSSNDLLTVSMTSNYDGCTILRTDTAASFICGFSDDTIYSTAYTNYSSANVSLVQSVIPLQQYPTAVPGATPAFSENIICGSPLDIPAPPSLSPVTWISTDHLHIHVLVPAGKTGSLRLFTLDGRLIDEVLTNGNSVVSLEAAISGIYIMQFVGENEVHCEKVLASE